ncbi:MAG: hypothetical protein AAFY52_12045 [Pseudomonadota bacterium]
MSVTSFHVLFLAMCVCAGAPIRLAAETPTAAMEPEMFKAPADGGVRRWQVVAADGVVPRKAPGDEKGAGPVFAGGAVVANHGCSDTGGSVWCAVGPLGTGVAGFIAAQALAPVTGPDGVVAVGVDDSDRRAKQRRFDAKAEVACAQEQGDALTTCTIGVARSGGGDASAALTFANGFSRYLYFTHGAFMRGSSTMSGAGRDIDWDIVDGIYRIRVDDQKVRVPVPLIIGK